MRCLFSGVEAAWASCGDGWAWRASPGLRRSLGSLTQRPFVDPEDNIPCLAGGGGGGGGGDDTHSNLACLPACLLSAFFFFSRPPSLPAFFFNFPASLSPCFLAWRPPCLLVSLSPLLPPYLLVTSTRTSSCLLNLYPTSPRPLVTMASLGYLLS